MSSYDPYRPRSPRPSYRWPLVLLLLVGGLIFWRVWPRWTGESNPEAVPRIVTPRGDLADEEKSTIALFRKVSPSVVYITTLHVQRDIFSRSVQEVPEGTGSGFIWDDQGNVVTNYHVIQNANAAKVILADQSAWDASLVAVHRDKDLAVLKIDAPKSRLHPIELGSSQDLQVGQNTFAIGNPFGLDQTLTKGIISALDREIESVTGRPIKGVIQTDAAINPGNSGGPLLDSYGRLIGVNTSILSPSRASAGIGFAIPVDEVNRAVPELIAHKRVVRPVLGIHVAEDQIARRAGVADGALILSVAPGSAAEKAGLQPTQRDANGRLHLGDVILALDGKPVKSTRTLYSHLEDYKVGDTVKVTVLRDSERVDVQATLQAAE
jgi:S1-C subfamily serine protease